MSTGRLKGLGFAAMLAAALATSAETVTVDNVQDLVDNLDRLNVLNSQAFIDHSYAGNRHDVIILKKGVYDVSGQSMCCATERPMDEEYNDSFSHIAISWLTLKGETDDPRDVVIHGNGTGRVIYMWLGTLQNVTVSNGYAGVSKTINGFTIDKAGGGVAARTESSKIVNCVITDCHAAKSGGGLYLCNAEGTLVENCTAQNNGGGINQVKPFVGGIIRGCRSLGAGSGGGGSVDSSLVNSVISNNVAVGYAGGCYYDGPSSKPGISNCLICCNSAHYGGGVVNGENKGVYDCIISNNVAECGGGVYDSGTLGPTKVYGGRIVHNLARSTTINSVVKGGGAWGQTVNDLYIYDAEISGNACALENSTSDRSGGAGENVNFVRCRIFNNFAYVGAALNWGSAEDCVISNNVSCGSNGMWHSMVRGTSHVTGCYLHGALLCSPGGLYGCTITGYNGTLSLYDDANVYTNAYFVNSGHLADGEYLFGNNLNRAHSLTNCLIFGNEVWNVLSSAGTGLITEYVNCTVTGNRNGSMYSGFHPSDYPGSRMIIRNCIITGNTAMDGSGTAWNFRPRYGSQETSVVIENSMIGPGGWIRTPAEWPVPAGYAWTGLIESNDPGFWGAGYTLKRVSPCRGVGRVEEWMGDACDIRGTGYPRLRDGRVDLGCYQCWLDRSCLSVILR